MSAIGGAGAGPQQHWSEEGGDAVPNENSRSEGRWAAGVRPAAQQRENARTGATFGGRRYDPWVLIGRAGRNENRSGETIRYSPGKISGPIFSTWEGRLGFCFCFFVCFVPVTARGSDRGSDVDCCFIFSECSPTEAARKERGSDDGCCFLFLECSPSGAAHCVVSCGNTGGRE